MSSRCSDPMGKEPYCHHGDRCLMTERMPKGKKELERDKKKKEKETEGKE